MVLPPWDLPAMMAMMFGILAVSVGLGWLLTALTRRYALARGILDRPNERSLHVAATPRGGGVSLVVPVLIAIALAGGLGLLERGPAMGLGFGGALVAGIGWLDDRLGLGAGLRALVHLVAATGLVASIGGFEHLRLGVASLTLGGWGSGCAVITVIWCTNLYNFMDGIDGLAGLEGVMIGGVGGVLLLVGGAPGLALVAWAIAGACGGFLVWNWPPARIFMGDAGSGLLGFLFGGLALAGERTSQVPALVWVLLLGVFIVDTTITLARRVVRGERWYAPHHSHAYQRLVRHSWTHRSVDIAVLCLNLVLASLAVVVGRWPMMLPAGLVVGGGVLAMAYLFVERRFPFPSSADSTA